VFLGATFPYRRRLSSTGSVSSGQPALYPETGVYRPGIVEDEFGQAFANVRNIARAR
jgi:hypothetical protein